MRRKEKEPALVEALEGALESHSHEEAGEGLASVEQIKALVKELCPALSLDKEEFQWLLEAANTNANATGRKQSTGDDERASVGNLDC